MNSTTEICEDKERVKLRKEMLCSPNWNTVLYLGHISSSRCPNDLKFLHKLGET